MAYLGLNCIPCQKVIIIFQKQKYFRYPTSSANCLMSVEKSGQNYYNFPLIGFNTGYPNKHGNLVTILISSLLNIFFVNVFFSFSVVQ